MFPSPTHQDPRNAPSHRSFLDARGRTDLDPLIVAEGDAYSASKAEPQPPRYTISFGFCCGGGPMPVERIAMRHVREVLRLKTAGVSGNVEVRYRVHRNYAAGQRKANLVH